MPYETITRVNDRLWGDDKSYMIDSYITVNRHFKDCIEQDLLPPSTGEDGLRALIFSQAIHESNRTGRAVVVDL
jgi:predicted dehydrogenase